MDKLTEIKQLINKLNEYSESYYLKDKPLVSDKVYDDLMDELEQLEKDTGVIMSNSPLHKVQGKLLDGFAKVKHTRPMKSADKTKDMNVVGKFISKNKTIESWKLDGLTIVARYSKGIYTQAITRGTSDVGEDVTETFKYCMNLPLTLPMPIDLEVRGECVISWWNFNKINEGLKEPYSHPRNLAAGSVRNFDTNVAKERFLEYKVFELVSIDGESMDVLDSFNELQRLGFDVVEHMEVDVNNYLEIDEAYFNPEKYRYPVDGTIYKYNSYEYGKQLGETEHHPLNMLARKWKDDLYETTLRDIEWNTTRSSCIAPVAIFDEVLLDNCATTRATLHNVSYIEDLELGIGDTVQIYKANGVIPKLHDNLTRSNTYKIIDKCPCCNGDVEIHNENGSKSLHCINPNCSAKFISKLTNFVNRNGMNIVGCSDSTLEALVDKKYVTSFVDLYHLDKYKAELSALPGFGAKSVSKLLKSIDDSRKVDLTHLITAMGIGLIGKSTAKLISKHCNGDIDVFTFIMENTSLEFSDVSGIGVMATTSLDNWWQDNRDMFYLLLEELEVVKPDENHGIEMAKITESSFNLQGKTFCITGKLEHFANRDSMIASIESHNGKYLSGVSAKLNYLVNNDKTSTSGKNKKAMDLGIEIISEQDYLQMIGE